MKPARRIRLNIFATLFLVAFLASQSVSIFGRSYVSSITDSAAYRFNDAGVVVTLVLKEVSIQALPGLSGVPTFFAQSGNLISKVSRPFLFTVADRNTFYRHITINAP